MKYIGIIIIAVALVVACESSNTAGGNTGKSGSMARFAISGNNLYTVSNYDLTVFDIENDAEPKEVSSQYLEGYVETIFAKDTLLFFGTRGGMYIYDNSNPDGPRFISEYSHIYSCDPVVVHKNIAFVTLNSASLGCGRNNNRLDIIDVSDPKNPSLIKEYNMESPKGLGIDGDVLFVCDNGLKAYHLTDFDDIEFIDKYDVDAYDVIPDNGYLFLIGGEGFYQFKYTDRTLMKVSSLLVDEEKGYY